jgi:hypothetical protein
MEKGGREPGRPVKLGDDQAHLVAGQDGWEPSRSLGSDHVVEPGQVLLEDVAVEEQESVQRLVLGRGGNLALDGQGTQEARDLGGAHLEGMRLAMEADVPADPPDVGRLGASTPVAQPDGFPDAVEQFRRARAGRARFARHQIRSRRSRVPDALIDDESHSARRIVPGQSTRKTSAEGIQ